MLAKLGLRITRVGPRGGRTYPLDFDDELIELCERVAPFTLTSPERIAALRDAVRHLVATGVPGALVECGVWRGGSAMVMAATLQELGVGDRDLYLFDTFTHMPLPGEHDVDVFGRHAGEYYDVASESEAFRYLTLEAVQDAVASTGFPRDRTHFVQGMVEDTIPGQAPERIALCRLDTDWYESTAHEMEHLYPRISPGGVLIIDDYGHFQGSKKAVDEYLTAHELQVLLHRIDFTGRMVVKPA
jgi:predicted O-methyltransferase YrrM